MERLILTGTPVSPGVAIGPLVILGDSCLFEKRFISREEMEQEARALQLASESVYADLGNTMRNVPAELAEYREIIAAQMELARDPKLIHAAIARIRRRQICAAWALSETIDELCSLFANMDDPYLYDRTHDIRTIGHALGKALPGFNAERSRETDGILAARELSPADLMDTAGIKGIMTVDGGATSHTAILARGLNVPAIVGIDQLFRDARQGQLAILDAVSGIAILNPNAQDLQKYAKRQKYYLDFEKEAQNFARLSAVTRDGKKIAVLANLDSSADSADLRGYGAEGIGLYRTEFSFMGSQRPDEESLVREYRQVLENVYPDPVVFRTLDVGADKILPAQMALHEPNPALGLRGIRFCLYEKEIFRTQLRAMLRASHGRNAALMLPMITNSGEITAARAIIAELEAELAARNIPHASRLPLGVMIETPAAVAIPDILAEHCDFFSIGTNDLLHYLLAIDRNNNHVSYLHDPLHPAFLRSLQGVIRAGHSKGLPVSVCGELAADPIGILLLVGLGIDTLSASPHAIPAIKQILRCLNMEQCARIAREALNADNTVKIRRQLHRILHESMGHDLILNNSLLANKK